MAGVIGTTGEILVVAALAIVYFVVAVFRAAFAELNAVAANRILAARGLGPRDGESPGEIVPILRTTVDLFHHVVLIAAAALTLDLCAAAGLTRPLLYAALSVTVVVAVIQMIARLLGVADPERAFSASLLPVALFYHAVRPLTLPAAWAIRRLRRSGRDRRAAAGDDEATDEEIEAFIDAGEQEGILEAEEGNLIRQVVEFHDSVVREVMTPRTEVVAVPTGTTLAQARALFAKERHSRMPVYREHIDHVEGVITLKDLVARWDELPDDAPVEKIMLPAYFVPETKQVAELLKELQARRIQLAIVVDEYGGTEGVVTIEDVLEQLVGDIQEEHEREEAPLVRLEDDSYLARGSASVEDLESLLGITIKAEGFETVSGLIYSVLGHIPREGESLEVNGLRLEVLKADKRRIERVRVTRLAETKTS